MESETQAFLEHNKDMKNMRLKRRSQWMAMAGQLVREGFKIEQITDYQFRITRADRKAILDFYPSNKRACEIPENKWHDVRGINPFNWIINYFRMRI